MFARNTFSMPLRFIRYSPFALILLILNACSGMVDVPSVNFNSRVDYLVIHATSENFEESLRLLTQPSENSVSSHYLIPTHDDASYPRNRLQIYRLVPEHERAWHAGLSYWGEETGLNDRSIGIEIVNEFTCEGTTNPIEETKPEDINCNFRSYDEEQIARVVELTTDILSRYPNINPIDVVGHSDIAILRRSDPGPNFPWKVLYEAGVGAWYDDETKQQYQQNFAQKMPAIASIQEALNQLGYLVEVSGRFDRQTRYALRAMQLHYRSEDYSGNVDVESAAIIWALLEKYRSQKMVVL